MSVQQVPCSNKSIYSKEKSCYLKRATLSSDLADTIPAYVATSEGAVVSLSKVFGGESSLHKYSKATWKKTYLVPRVLIFSLFLCVHILSQKVKDGLWGHPIVMLSLSIIRDHDLSNERTCNNLS